jgi:hypothetical protein
VRLQITEVLTPRLLHDEPALSAFTAQPYGELFVAPVDGSSEPVRVTHNKWERKRRAAQCALPLPAVMD